MKNKNTMTVSEYVSKKGILCPVCKSKDIQGHEINIDAGIATQEVTCNNCNAAWQDVYKLSGFVLGG